MLILNLSLPLLVAVLVVEVVVDVEVVEGVLVVDDGGIPVAIMI